MSTDPRIHLRTELRHLALQTALVQPPSALVGVGSDAAGVLAEIQVFTIFDLALSKVFTTATELTQTASDSVHPFRRLGRVAADRVSGRGGQVDVAAWVRMPIEALDGVSSRLGARLRDTLSVRTIGDLAAWPPFLAARSLVDHAIYGPLGQDGADLEAPADLVPRNGDYPTEKVYYTHLFLRELGDTGAGVEISPTAIAAVQAGQQPTTAAPTPGGLDALLQKRLEDRFMRSERSFEGDTHDFGCGYWRGVQDILEELMGSGAAGLPSHPLH